MKIINVTQPYMPPLEEYVAYLEQTWKSKWLTNNGQFHEQLELELCNYLGVKYISLFSNGTLALLTALQALRITGEVITTPFSFVATTHALHWNGIKPVFCDIDPDFCNLDPEKIESLITPFTTAILPVHVYGNPCGIERIQKIADIYGLKVIYDGCHAFGVKINNQSILNYGDLSILSFHATKVFNTFEGGAIVCHDQKTKKRIDYLKNFGFADELTVIATGINAKMNEAQAAFGLLNLKYIDKVLEKRRIIAEYYRTNLSDIKGLRCLTTIPFVDHNNSYFPIFVDYKSYQLTRDEVYDKMKLSNINCRRYFYPLISQFQAYRGLPSADPIKLPKAEQIARQVLCLPIYPDLELEDVKTICNLLKNKFQ
jgi:dTDP-4-amino-4,6-dideoxygalactose transaminase